jgi:hypothetical protein
MARELLSFIVDILNMARDVLSFAVDVLNMACDVLSFAVDVLNMARDVLSFAVDVLNMARDVLSFAVDVLNMACDVLREFRGRLLFSDLIRACVRTRFIRLLLATDCPEQRAQLLCNTWRKLSRLSVECPKTCVRAQKSICGVLLL